jgi:lipid A disaccharide synthetase
MVVNVLNFDEEIKDEVFNENYSMESFELTGFLEKIKMIHKTQKIEKMKRGKPI